MPARSGVPRRRCATSCEVERVEAALGRVERLFGTSTEPIPIALPREPALDHAHCAFRSLEAQRSEFGVSKP